MEIPINNLISRKTFIFKFGLLSPSRYRQFIKQISEKLRLIIDKETKIVSLTLNKRWKDYGCNTHVIIQGNIIRRNEQANLRAEIVWLKRLKSFRGSFWSDLTPKSDTELFNEAKHFFHVGKYADFLAISEYIKEKYSKNKIFSKMRTMAKCRTLNQS